MPVSEVVAEHYAQRQAVADDVVAEGERLWRQVDSADIAGSWQESIPRLTVGLAAAQRVTASQADSYADTVLRELNVDTDPAGRVNPASLTGRASDGRSLVTLLAGPVITAKVGLARGATLDRSLASGMANLEMILRTQVADAGRVADGVAVAARPKVGYIRHVTPPSCPRCVILAGRFYRYSAGFQRHPSCDCTHAPASQSVSGDLTTDPKRLFDEGQVTGLSKADTRAIIDGADMSQVVNAHRGMRTAAVHGRRLRVTTEGMTRRGTAGRRIRRQQGPQGVRLMPEEIYRIADSRAHAIELLRRNAYIN